MSKNTKDIIVDFIFSIVITTFLSMVLVAINMNHFLQFHELLFKRVVETETYHEEIGCGVRMLIENAEKSADNPMAVPFFSLEFHVPSFIIVFFIIFMVVFGLAMLIHTLKQRKKQKINA